MGREYNMRVKVTEKFLAFSEVTLNKPLNLDSDNRINPTSLTDEFREFSPTLYSYLEAKAEAKSIFENLKSAYEEASAEQYLAIKSSGEKVTEKHVEALLETNPGLKVKKLEMLKAKRDLDTVENYVESLRAKKDMLIQMGADARKE